MTFAVSKCFNPFMASLVLSRTPFLLLRPVENKIYNQTPASGSISEES